MANERWKKLAPIEKLMAAESAVENPVVITGCMSLAENLDIKWFNKVFLPRLLHHPRFSSRLVGNDHTQFSYQPVPGFTIDSDLLQKHHVSIEPIIDPSKTWQQREQIFSERLSEIISTPLDLSRPLWKLHVFPAWSVARLDNDDTSQSCTIVFRVHHSIGDGVGLVKFFTSELTDTPKEATASQVLVLPHRQQKRKAQPLTRKISFLFIFRLLFMLMRKIFEVVEDTYNSTIRVLICEPKSTFTRTPIQREKVCALLPPSEISLAELKTAARQLNATLNDVFYTAISGSTRRYLQETGDNPRDLKSMRVGIPVNGHALDSFRQQDVSNKFAIVSIPLHVSEPRLVDRLQKCKSGLLRMKRSLQPAMLMTLVGIVCALPHRTGRRIWRRLTRVASMLFTNVPGPTKNVEMGGVKVTSMHCFAPSDGHIGVVVSLLSYAGRIAIGVSGDKGRIADPQRFVEILQEEIHSLIDLAHERK